MKRRNFFQTLLASLTLFGIAPKVKAEPVGQVRFSDPMYVWSTANGRWILVERMDTDHIINTIRCLKGKSKTRIPDPYLGRSNQEWRRIFIKELERRKVMLLDIQKIHEKA